jgi:glycosyltransferase involved in cell wall biosynthesis
VKVSIITVVYNAEKTIRDCIESVLGQSYKPLEYVIIDGGSTDSTMEIINSYSSRISRVLSEPDEGIYDAMNKGIGLATGELVGLLNSDDLYAYPEAVADLVAALQHNQADAVYGDLLYVKPDNLNQVTRRWVAGSYRHGMFSWGWMPPHPTFIIKRDWYLRYGNFRKDLGSAADYELMLRMIHKHRARLSYLPRVVVKMRTGGVSNSSVSNRLRANQLDRTAWSVNGLEPNFFTLYLKPLRKIVQFIIR